MMADEHTYLIFTLQNRWFAFDLSQIAEVEELPIVWPIPATPACYPGAVNFHGTIVAVMDLADFLGYTNRITPEILITLDLKIASLAFQVEQVIRITPVGEGRLDPAPNEEFAIATLTLPDGTATLLDARLIVDRAAETING